MVYGDHNRTETCLVRIIRNCTNQYLQQGYSFAIYSAVCNDLLQCNYRLGVVRGDYPLRGACDVPYDVCAVEGRPLPLPGGKTGVPLIYTYI